MNDGRVVTDEQLRRQNFEMHIESDLRLVREELGRTKERMRVLETTVLMLEHELAELRTEKEQSE